MSDREDQASPSSPGGAVWPFRMVPPTDNTVIDRLSLRRCVVRQRPAWVV